MRSLKTAEVDTGDTSQQMGRRSDTLSPLLSAGTHTNSIKQLLMELKGLCEQRLRCLELDTSVTPEVTLQRKVDFLWSYMSDLAEQNQVLVQTIEDLQRDADRKVSFLGREVHSSDCVLDEPEGELRTLLLDELVDVAAIPHKFDSLAHVASEFEEPKTELQAKDMVISEVERELRERTQQNEATETRLLEDGQRLEHLRSEISCLQLIQKDNVKEIAEKDIYITKLQANILLLQQENVDTYAQHSKLNARASELQEKVTRVEDALRLRYEKKLLRAEARGRQELQEREEEWRKRGEEERKADAEAIKKWAEEAAFLKSELEVSRKQVELQTVELSECHRKEEILLLEIKEREAHVRHLDQDAVGLRATQDSLKSTLTMKEKHTRQLVRDNARLKGSLAALQSKLQTSGCTLSGISETLDRAEADLRAERQRGRQIQEQLERAIEEAEQLHSARRATEKKIQKRKIKMCALVKELMEVRRQHSGCQEKLLSGEKSLDKLREDREDLRAKLEDRGRECVNLSQTKESLQTHLALGHKKLHTSHLEVRSRDQLILQLRAEMRTVEEMHRSTRKQTEEKLKTQEAELELLRQKLRSAKEELKEAGLRAQEQEESVAIFKQKYTVAIEKVHKAHGRVQALEEELRYSEQQLGESRLATQSVKEELVELERRYQEKVAQWENSQEALDQLTDELQANQNLLNESQQRVHHLRSLMHSLEEQVDTLKQQKIVFECELRLYQQSHSHSDEEHISLLRHREQVQKRCTEQVERLAECEKVILQMKSELERQHQEQATLKQRLVTSRRTHLSDRSHLEQEVAHLSKETERLQAEVADAHKVRVTLLRRAEEELKEARQDAARSGGEAEVQRGEVRRLQEKLRKEEETTEGALREKEGLGSRVRQLRHELEGLRETHRLTVEELAARAEEAKRMAGCLNEGSPAEEKIRSVAARLETEVEELRRSRQQAEREKQKTQEQVDELRSKLEGTWSDNANLRQESQLVMTNAKRWIAEQKASNSSLQAQMKAQNKALLILAEEKMHLQGANDALKADVKRLKDAAAERERETGRLKAQIREQNTWQDERSAEKKKERVALNLSKIEDMQTRLRSNLEAIRMLNQQLGALSAENRSLRRQLEEEREKGSLRGRVEPSTPQRCPAARPPLSLDAHPLPLSASLLSSLPPS